jgi:hypothetical protein
VWSAGVNQLEARVYLKKWDGSKWIGLGDSGSTYGISGRTPNYYNQVPSVTVDSNGNIIVAWVKGYTISPGVFTSPVILVKKWDGANWSVFPEFEGWFPVQVITDHDNNPIVGFGGFSCVKWAPVSNEWKVYTPRDDMPRFGTKLVKGKDGSIFFAYAKDSTLFIIKKYMDAIYEIASCSGVLSVFDLTIDADNNAIIACMGSDGWLYIKFWDGTQFTSSEKLPFYVVKPYWPFSIAESEGKVFLTTPFPVPVLVASWDGNMWSTLGDDFSTSLSGISQSIFGSYSPVFAKGNNGSLIVAWLENPIGNLRIKK